MSGIVEEIFVTIQVYRSGVSAERRWEPSETTAALCRDAATVDYLNSYKFFQKFVFPVSSAGKFVCRLIERAAAAGRKK